LVSVVLSSSSLSLLFPLSFSSAQNRPVRANSKMPAARTGGHQRRRPLMRPLLSPCFGPGVLIDPRREPAPVTGFRGERSGKPLSDAVILNPKHRQGKHFFLILHQFPISA